MRRVKVALEVLGFGLWGSGKETFEADLVTFKTVVGGRVVPAIPGSYVKGLLRGWAHRLAPLLSAKGVIAARANEDCSPRNPCRDCVVCAIFGAPGGAQSPLAVTNFYPVRADALGSVKGAELEDLLTQGGARVWDAVELAYVPHVRICDASAKAAEGGLFVQEAVPPRTTFVGELRLADHLLEGVEADDAMLLVALSLAQLNHSYAGRRTRVRVRVLEHDAPEGSRSRPVLEALGGV